LKSDYRYSNRLVYNNFPWPSDAAEQHERIEEKARAVVGNKRHFLSHGKNIGCNSRKEAPYFQPNGKGVAFVINDRLPKSFKTIHGCKFFIQKCVNVKTINWIPFHKSIPFEYFTSV